MSTTITHEYDERSPAVQHAATGAQAWRAAVHAQQATEPVHADFYALAGDLVDTLRSLDALVAVLTRQAGTYGTGREVYDDENANPAHRLRSAVLALVQVRHELSEAERSANRFFSAIGHIGVRYTGEGEQP
jgi:hypothetical protein